MIIQCDHCSAKFRMDDSKLANGAVKVRCAKCKQVFVVKKEPETPEPPTPSTAPDHVAAVAQGSAAFFAGETSKSDSGFSFESDDSAQAEAAPSFAGGSLAQDEFAKEFDWKDSSGFGENDNSAFDIKGFSEDAAGRKEIAGQADVSGGNDFDFGDVQLPTETSAAEKSTELGASPAKDDFSLDFGDVSFAATPAEATPPPFEFSFSDEPQGSTKPDSTKTAADTAGPDDFLLSFDSESSGGGSATALSGAATPGASDFGEFDFGTAENQSATKLEVPSEAATPAAAVVPTLAPDMPLEPTQEELPPASLTTRKKRGSLFPLFVILGAIILIIALAGSGVYFFGGPKAFSKVGLGFLVEWYGEKVGEEGDIALRNLSAEYVVNKEAGELFIVRGEAVNNFKKPRASIQIKVTLLGSGGASLKTKTAFCGNPLSNEQLANTPLAKIEEIMSNQFGDSLANLGVKPGNAIPFAVAVSAVPKEATDYSVQVGGSTVATQ